MLTLAFAEFDQKQKTKLQLLFLLLLIFGVMLAGNLSFVGRDLFGETWIRVAELSGRRYFISPDRARVSANIITDILVQVTFVAWVVATLVHGPMRRLISSNHARARILRLKQNQQTYASIWLVVLALLLAPWGEFIGIGIHRTGGGFMLYYAQRLIVILLSYSAMFDVFLLLNTQDETGSQRNIHG